MNILRSSDLSSTEYSIIHFSPYLLAIKLDNNEIKTLIEIEIEIIANTIYGLFNRFSDSTLKKYYGVYEKSNPDGYVIYKLLNKTNLVSDILTGTGINMKVKNIKIDDYVDKDWFLLFQD
ncbi:MAG: hypothetical protein QW478_00195 [Candidatus Micrarchaeaceae archaeon]